jgi:hypothetical protein
MSFTPPVLDLGQNRCSDLGDFLDGIGPGDEDVLLARTAEADRTIDARHVTSPSGIPITIGSEEIAR